MRKQILGWAEFEDNVALDFIVLSALRGESGGGTQGEKTELSACCLRRMLLLTRRLQEMNEDEAWSVLAPGVAKEVCPRGISDRIAEVGDVLSDMLHDALWVDNFDEIWSKYSDALKDRLSGVIEEDARAESAPRAYDSEVSFDSGTMRVSDRVSASLTLRDDFGLMLMGGDPVSAVGGRVADIVESWSEKAYCAVCLRLEVSCAFPEWVRVGYSVAEV